MCCMFCSVGKGGGGIPMKCACIQRCLGFEVYVMYMTPGKLSAPELTCFN